MNADLNCFKRSKTEFNLEENRSDEMRNVSSRTLVKDIQAQFKHSVSDRNNKHVSIRTKKGNIISYLKL